MKVDFARRKLIQLLRSPRPLAGRRGELTLAIWTWWNAYKQWEEEDTFLTAFREQRLCITQRPSEENVKGAIKTSYEMQAKRGSGDKAPKTSSDQWSSRIWIKPNARMHG
jgi:hypothetical protein